MNQKWIKGSDLSENFWNVLHVDRLKTLNLAHEMMSFHRFQSAVPFQNRAKYGIKSI